MDYSARESSGPLEALSRFAQEQQRSGTPSQALTRDVLVQTNGRIGSAHVNGTASPSGVKRKLTIDSTDAGKSPKVASAKRTKAGS